MPPFDHTQLRPVLRCAADCPFRPPPALRRSAQHASSDLPAITEDLFRLLGALEALCEDRIARGIEREHAAQIQAQLRYRMTRLVRRRVEGAAGAVLFAYTDRMNSNSNERGTSSEGLEDRREEMGRVGWALHACVWAPALEGRACVPGCMRAHARLARARPGWGTAG